jgi:hypothetical protein
MMPGMSRVEESEPGERKQSEGGFLLLERRGQGTELRIAGYYPSEEDARKRMGGMVQHGEGDSFFIVPVLAADKPA